MLLMQLPVAVEALSALAHSSRLAVFRLLVRAGAEGVAAGDIAREIGAHPSTLSTHLTILGHAGLVRSRREGRGGLERRRLGARSPRLGVRAAARTEPFARLGQLGAAVRARHGGRV